MKLADQISKTLVRFVNSGSDIVVPNFYVGKYECDVMKLTKSGVFTEYEIKISRADFFNDFKKEHQERDMTDYVKGVSNWYSMPILTYNKHKLTELGNRANKFYFVVPDGLIAPSEVPKYSGLIYYYNGRIRVVKNAKQIHKNKGLIDLEALALKLSFREQAWRQKYNNYLPEIKKYRNYQAETDKLNAKIQLLELQIEQMKDPNNRSLNNLIERLNRKIK